MFQNTFQKRMVEVVKVFIIFFIVFSFLGFPSFSVAQEVMTNTEIKNPQQIHDSKSDKKSRKAKKFKHKKRDRLKYKRTKSFKKRMQKQRHSIIHKENLK